MKHINKNLALIALLLSTSISHNLYAAQAIPSQEVPSVKAEKQIENPNPILNPETTTFQESKNDAKVYVKRFHIVNLPTSSQKLAKNLHKLLTKHENKMVGMNDLFLVIRDINIYLRSHGYPAATAYFPEQSSLNGELQLKLELGRYGKINYDNQSKLNKKTLKLLTTRLKQGHIIKTRKIESVINNIIDLGGVKAGALFKPGENLGETDITLKIMKAPQSDLTLFTENYGSKTSGRYRYGLATNWNNLGGHGESLKFYGTVSNQKQHNYNFLYEQLIAKNGTKLEINCGKTDYELGSIYSEIGAEGKTSSIGLTFNTPLWKTSTSNMNINYGFVHRKLKDEMRNFEYCLEKHSNVGFLGINGREQNNKVLLYYDLNLTSGKLVGDKAYVGSTSLEFANEGQYTKGFVNGIFQYQPEERLAITFKVQGQQTSRTLDSSEQMYLGGANGVRAFPQGEGSGDEGYQATYEFSYKTKFEGLTTSLYYDIGHVKYTKDNSVVGGVTLKGWGLGLSYNDKAGYWGRLDYARRIGLPDGLSKAAKAKQRIWFIFGKRW